MSFANDTFTDASGTNIADHTSDSGDSWSEIESAHVGQHLQIDSNGRLSSPSSVLKAALLSASPPSADYAASCDVQKAHVQGNNGAIVRGDSVYDSGSGHTYVVGYGTQLVYGNPSTFALIRYNADGSTTSLQTGGGYGSVATYNCEVKAVGSTISGTISVGGTVQETISATDATFSSAGNPGVATNQPDTHSWLDNLVASAAGSGGATYNLSASESGTLGDAQAATGVFSVSVSESGAANDSQANTASLKVATSDSGAISSSQGITASLLKSISESLTGADSASSAGTVYSLSASQAGSLGDTGVAAAQFAVNVHEAAQAADALTVVGTYPVGVSESAQGAASLSAVIHASLAVSESAQASESQSSAGEVYDLSASESAAAQDSSSSSAQLAAAIQESLQGADAQGCTIISHAKVSDGAVMADTVRWVAIYNGHVSEAGVLSDVAGAVSERIYGLLTVVEKPDFQTICQQGVKVTVVGERILVTKVEAP